VAMVLTPPGGGQCPLLQWGQDRAEEPISAMGLG